MLIEAVLLSKVGNGILPLAGIIAMGVTPALLVVTRGKLLRMIIFGTLLLPLFLLSGTLIAPFATELAKGVGAFPAGVSQTQFLKDQSKNFLVGQLVTLQLVISKQSLVL